MQNIDVIDNIYDNHRDILRRNIKYAEEIDIVVAFAKLSGMSGIDKLLRNAVESGTPVRIIVGLDFYISDPELLRYLYKFQHKTEMRVYVKVPSKETFHTKLYAFYSKRRTNIVIGSANFTRGGLVDNWELSTYIKDANPKTKERIRQYVDSLLFEETIMPLTPAIISDYEKKYQFASAYRGFVEKKIEQGSPSDEEAGIKFFEIRLETYRADGFEETMAARNDRRTESRAILKEIADKNYTSSASFLKDFDRLIRLYNSSSLHRGKNTIAKERKEVVNLYKTICGFDGEDEASLVERTLTIINSIDKFGMNLLTEPLHSINNNRFAIMNNNSVYGLKKAIGKDYEKFLNKKVVKSDIYLEFCSDMIDVMTRLRLQNLSELDTLFNYFYYYG